MKSGIKTAKKTSVPKKGDVKKALTKKAKSVKRKVSSKTKSVKAAAVNKVKTVRRKTGKVKKAGLKKILFSVLYF